MRQWAQLILCWVINQQEDQSCQCATTRLVTLHCLAVTQEETWVSSGILPFRATCPGMTHKILIEAKGEAFFRKNKWRGFKLPGSCTIVTVVLWTNTSDVNLPLPCAQQQWWHHHFTVRQAVWGRLLYRYKTTIKARWIKDLIWQAIIHKRRSNYQHKSSKSEFWNQIFSR